MGLFAIDETFQGPKNTSATTRCPSSLQSYSGGHLGTAPFVVNNTFLRLSVGSKLLTPPSSKLNGTPDISAGAGTASSSPICFPVTTVIAHSLHRYITHSASSLSSFLLHRGHLSHPTASRRAPWNTLEPRPRPHGRPRPGGRPWPHRGRLRPFFLFLFLSSFLPPSPLLPLFTFIFLIFPPFPLPPSPSLPFSSPHPLSFLPLPPFPLAPRPTSASASAKWPWPASTSQPCLGHPVGRPRAPIIIHSMTSSTPSSPLPRPPSPLAHRSTSARWYASATAEVGPWLLPPLPPLLPCCILLPSWVSQSHVTFKLLLGSSFFLFFLSSLLSFSSKCKTSQVLKDFPPTITTLFLNFPPKNFPTHSNFKLSPQNSKQLFFQMCNPFSR